MKHLHLLSALAEKQIKVSCIDEKLRIEAPPGSLTLQEREQLSTLKSDIIATFRQYNIESNFSISNLSDQQLGIWYVDSLNGSSTQYNIVSRYDIEGKIDSDILNDCFKILIERHDILKTNIVTDQDNIPWQLVNNSHPVSLQVIDIPDTGETPETVFQQYEDREYERVFSLDTDLLIYIVLLGYSYRGKIYQSLILNIHHLVFDGWSLGIFIAELQTLYSARIKGGDGHLKPLNISYRDFSRWQKAWLQSDSMKKETAYWGNQLKDIPEVHSLPLDFQRPAVLGTRGSNFRVSVPAPLTTQISNLAQAKATSVFVAWYTLFSLYIARLSQSKDVVVGTAVANREVRDTKEMVGLFINTIVLRMKLGDAVTLIESLAEAKEIVNKGYTHQSTPLRLMIELSKATPSLSYSPLVQINFSYADIQSIKLENAVLTPSPYKVKFAKFDLSLTVENTVNATHINWEFNKDLFSEETIAIISKNFLYFISEVLDKEQSNVFHQKFCHPDLWNRLISTNDTEKTFYKSSLFFQEFEKTCLRRPENIAIQDINRSYSYSELNILSNRISHFLQGHFFISPDSVIAICLNRSADMIAYMLGIMKAGAAYLPLDPNFPANRLQYMLDDANPICLITTQSLLQGTAFSYKQNLLIDADEVIHEVAQCPHHNPQQRDISGTQLAYVIYTSGSTGRPKGVMIEHRSLSNFLYSMQETPGMTADDRLLAVTSTSFDIHILELFLPLVCGASVVVANSEAARDPGSLMRLINAYKITMMQATPTSWSMLFDAGWKADTGFKALCGGEPLNNILLHQFTTQENVQLWNMYGPTETTVWSAIKLVQSKASIGYPIANTQLFLLDEGLNPVPPGCVGELFIGGLGLARGYLNAPDLTREKFIDQVIMGKGTYRLYKTGDLCKLTSQGDIQFIGRADNQVKVRGFRIELAEIEKVILESGYVNGACAVIKQLQENPFICAYITQDEDNIGSDLSALRDYLTRNLPDYMVPARIEVLNMFPETPNRKIDRKSLAEKPIAYAARIINQDLTVKDRILIEAMCEVLGLNSECMTIDDNFYHLGGDSISALRYIAAVKRKGYTFTLQDLIKSQSVRNLSPHVMEYEIPEPEKAAFTGVLDITLDHQYILDKEKLINNFTINGLMSLSEPLDKPLFAKAFAITTLSHEVIRTRFIYQNGKWTMNVSEPSRNFSMEEFALLLTSEDKSIESQLEEILRSIKTKLNLADGIHYTFASIHSDDNRYSLMFSANHSVVDGYSNGVFLEDLFINYKNLKNNQNDIIPTAPPSINKWSSAIRGMVNSSEFLEHFAYWNSLDWETVKPLPSDFDTTTTDNLITHASSATVSERLDPVLTNALRVSVPELLKISHLEFVIAVISLTLQQSFGLSKPYIHVMDAGRGFYNQLLKASGIDMSRVVSSLSELAPKFFLTGNVPLSDEVTYLTSFSEKLRKSAHHAQTFRLLKHGSANKDIRASMNNFSEPDILVNFLGMTDLKKIGESSKANNGFLPEISQYNSLISPVTLPGDAPLERRLLLAWHVIDDQLEMNWHYSALLNTAESIRNAARTCKDNITRSLLAIQSLKRPLNPTRSLTTIA